MPTDSRVSLESNMRICSLFPPSHRDRCHTVILLRETPASSIVYVALMIVQ